MRGFPARGYFIPGRDGARARPLGKVPCRRRATESDGEGWGARTSYFHPTRKQAPDKETSTRRGNKHPTRKQALNKETGTQQGNRHSTRKQALNKETGTQQESKHSTRKQALNKETSTQQGNKHSTSKNVVCFVLDEVEAQSVTSEQHRSPHLRVRITQKGLPLWKPNY